jgi:hypothetical protein
MFALAFFALRLGLKPLIRNSIALALSVSALAYLAMALSHGRVYLPVVTLNATASGAIVADVVYAPKVRRARASFFFFYARVWSRWSSGL